MHAFFKSMNVQTNLFLNNLGNEERPEKQEWHGIWYPQILLYGYRAEFTTEFSHWQNIASYIAITDDGAEMLDRSIN